MTHIESFRVVLETGTATMRLERSYWHAYKKIKGRLNKEYVGKLEDFTEQLLIDVVRKVNIEKPPKPKEVTYEKYVTDESNPVVPGVSLELAGHQKNANQLQTNLIPVDEELSMVKNELAALKATLAMNQNDYMVLHEQCRQAQRDRLKIIEEKEAIAKDLLAYSTNHRNHQLGVLVAQERMRELENTIEALKQDLVNHRDEGTKYYNELEQERWESSRREEQVQGYYFMHEELSEQVFKYRTLIEKYRLLAKGKDKRNHPRFAYMIDFLAEIDNLT